MNNNLTAQDGLFTNKLIQTEKILLESNIVAEKMSAKFVLIKFEHHRLIYNTHVIGKNLPEDTCFMLLNKWVKKFTRKNNIELFETYPVLMDYISQFKAPLSYDDDLPYNIYDEHHSIIKEPKYR